MREAVEDHGGNQKRWNFSESNKKGYVRELAEARDRAGVKRARPAPPRQREAFEDFPVDSGGVRIRLGASRKRPP